MKTIRSRIRVAMFLVFTMAAGVVLRASYVQVIRDPKIERLAKRQFKSNILIRPKRGPIVDRNGEALAINSEIQSLAASPQKVTNDTTLARLLSKSLGISEKTLRNRFKNKNREFTWIKRHLTEADLNRLKKLGVIDSSDTLPPGLWLVKENKRIYPHKELAAHVLGDVNLDSEGLEGVELWAEKRLKGKVISVAAVRDALGRPAFMDAIAANQIREGDPVVLTLDASLQFAVEKELRESIEKTGAQSGSVIVMNSVNGEILAMANYPEFNPNKPTKKAGARRNRAITDGFEPGSTMKPVLLAAALNKGHKITDRFHGEDGSFVIQGKRISEAESHEKFKWITLKDMIKVSSNVVSSKLAIQLGSKYLHDTYRDYGFGSKTGVGFPGEISGWLLPVSKWKPLTLANVGFGQGLMVTPIQMARIYASFLNGGWLVQPTLLRTPLEGYQEMKPKRIFSQKVADQVILSLLAVTEDGTGKAANLEGYRVAGKTGTAQVVDPETKRYSRSRYIASFVGFAVDVEPKLVIFTSLDHPKTSIYAAETATPLFRSVLQAATTRFSIPTQIKPDPVLAKKTKPSPVKHSDEIRLSQAIPVSKLEWKGVNSKGKMTWETPSFKGLTAREALRALGSRPFEIRLKGQGLIRSQFPEPGKVLSEGDSITLHLSHP